VLKRDYPSALVFFKQCNPEKVHPPPEDKLVRTNCR